MPNLSSKRLKVLVVEAQFPNLGRQTERQQKVLCLGRYRRRRSASSRTRFDVGPYVCRKPVEIWDRVEWLRNQRLRHV